MSFPVILHSPDGEQFNTYAAPTNTTTKQPYRWPLGTQLWLQGGRKYRFVVKSTAAAVVANVQQAAANTANHLNNVLAAAAAVGDRSVQIALAGTDTAANEYAQGYAYGEDGAGEGYMHLIDNHLATTGAATITANLAPGHSVQVAATTASEWSIIRNPYRSVLIMPTTPTQIPVGVAVGVLGASRQGWLQTGGPAVVLTQGTLVLGNKAQLSTTTAGAVCPVADDIQAHIGWVMRVAATTEHSAIYLTID